MYYVSDGELIWSSTVSGGHFGYTSDLVVDPESGNIYFSTEDVIGYSPDGVQLFANGWDATWATPVIGGYLSIYGNTYLYTLDKVTGLKINSTVR